MAIAAPISLLISLETFCGVIYLGIITMFVIVCRLDSIKAFKRRLRGWLSKLCWYIFSTRGPLYPTAYYVCIRIGDVVNSELAAG